MNALKGKKEEAEKPSPPKALVLEHATTAEIQPWVDHVEQIEDHLGAIRAMMRTWLDEEAKRLMRAQMRIEVQEEESRKRVQEQEVLLAKLQRQHHRGDS